MNCAPVITLDTNLNAATAVRFYALAVLRLHGGDRTKASKSLDVDPGTIRRWMDELAAAGVVVPKAIQGRPINPKGRGPTRLNVPLGMLGENG